MPATWVVTGAGSGIGLAVTRALLAHAGVARVFALLRGTGPMRLRRGRDAPRPLVAHAGRLRRCRCARAGAGIAQRTDAVHLLFNASRATPADGGRFLAWDGAEIPW